MSSFPEKKSSYENEREVNIRRNEELLRRLGINMRENQPTFQHIKQDFSSNSESESDQDWNPNEDTKVKLTEIKPILKQVPYAPGLVDRVTKAYEMEEKEKRKVMKRKLDSSSGDNPNPKKTVDKSRITKDFTFGKAKVGKINNSKFKKNEKDCFEDLKYIEFCSDDETAKTEKVSYEEFLKKREDTLLMEEGIALVSRYIWQQKLEENLEIQESKEITNEFETLSIERSRRHLKPVDYTEEELTTEDCYIYCEECDELHFGNCPVYGELEPLDETEMKTNSLSTIPIPKHLSLKVSPIPNAGLGIFAREIIPTRTRMGPYAGTLVKGSVDDFPNESEYLWQIKRDAGRTVWYIDGADLNRANWLRFVNCARNEDEQNLFAFQFRGRIYYRSYKVINPGEELLVYYGDSYAKQLGIEKLESNDGNKEEKVFQESTVRRTVYRTQKDKTFKCQLCSCSFQHESSLTVHTRIHTGVNLHICNVCKKKFTRESMLTKHTRTHTGEKPFECNTCKKRFSQSGHLFLHTRAHTGEKPYMCSTCKRGFTTSGNLTSHIRTHTGEKPFECITCKKRFAQSWHLTLHIRTHTGEKPFECNTCKKRFAQSGQLFIHTRTHTGEKPYVCSTCKKGLPLLVT